MKLTIEQDMSQQEPEIIIRCGLMDRRLKRLVEEIRLYSFSIPVREDSLERQIPLESVCYFESVDDRTYLYTRDAVFPCERRLYELEALLAETGFARISKNCILNIGMVSGVRAQLNGRLEAVLLNGEKLVVSKHYVPGFRAKFQ